MGVDKIRYWFKQIFMTKLGLIAPAFIWFFIWYALSDRTTGDWRFWVSMVGLGYNVLLVLLMLIFAFIVNPIRGLFNQKKCKCKNKVNCKC